MKLVLLFLTLLGLLGCSNKSAPAPVGITADAETQPVTQTGDVADDPAIWVHPDTPEKSLIIGTNKSGGGLEVYTLDGTTIQTLPDGKFNNVDLRYGMTLQGIPTDIVVATNRSDDTLAIYGIDAGSLTLRPIAARKIETLPKSYGLCMYHSPLRNAYYVFVNNKAGEIRQYELFDDNGSVNAKEVRRFAVASQPEGCVADDELQSLYVGEEDAGIWRFSAEPDAPDTRTLIDSTREHLVADVEGLALYMLPQGEGYLIASSQGNSSYTLYDRRHGTYLGSFRIVDSTIDGTSDTDGLDITAAALGTRYPFGMLVVQDGSDLPSEKQNFKMIRAEKIFEALHLPYKQGIQ